VYERKGLSQENNGEKKTQKKLQQRKDPIHKGKKDKKALGNRKFWSCGGVLGKCKCIRPQGGKTNRSKSQRHRMPDVTARAILVKIKRHEDVKGKVRLANDTKFRAQMEQALCENKGACRH